MALNSFITELQNVSAHLHNLKIDRFFFKQIDGERYVSVYMDGLGWFDGDPAVVLHNIVEAAKVVCA